MLHAAAYAGRVRDVFVRHLEDSGPVFLHLILANACAAGEAWEDSGPVFLHLILVNACAAGEAWPSLAGSDGI